MSIIHGRLTMATLARIFILWHKTTTVIFGSEPLTVCTVTMEIAFFAGRRRLPLDGNFNLSCAVEALIFSAVTFPESAQVQQREYGSQGSRIRPGWVATRWDRKKRFWPGLKESSWW